MSRETAAQERSPGPARGDPGLLAARVNEIYHDLQAAEFDQLHSRRHRVERLFWQRHVAPLLAKDGAQVGVDLCTGTGLVPGVLLAALDATAAILCVDLSPKALEKAKQKLGGLAARAAFHAGDAASLPLPDGAADWVSLNAGLHHIPDPARLLGEVDRVLRPGGLFCLGYEPNQAFFTSRALRRLGRVIWYVFWYLSPSRNVRRLWRRLRPKRAPGERDYLQPINEALLAEGLVDSPLTSAQLHDLVDVHTHRHGGEADKVGFVVDELLRGHFPSYALETLCFTDYGGALIRNHPWLRAALDGVLRRLSPRRGRLFSFIVRKPTGDAISSGSP